MSRPRTRPTRDETRARIFEAAAGVFAEHGVAAATIEQIASAAEFTRGAFYSNFESKDELAVAMLEDHLAHSETHNRGLLEAHGDPVPVLGDRARRPLGVLERGRADVDPAAASRQRPVQRRGIPDAAAHLDVDVQAADDLGEEGGTYPLVN